MGSFTSRWQRAVLTAAVAVSLIGSASVWAAPAGSGSASTSIEAEVGNADVSAAITSPGTTPSTQPFAVGSQPGAGPSLPLDGLPTSGSNTPDGAAPACEGDEDPAIGCGIRVVGHNDLLGRTNNFNLAMVGSCAYVSSSGDAEPALLTPPALAGPTDGVAVLDVSDSGHPRLVQFLRTQGAVDAGETISAVEAGDRRVLVVGSYGGRSVVEGSNSVVGPALDIYDVSGDCTQPIHTSTVYWPDNAHNVTLNPSGTRVYGTRYASEPKATATTAVNSLLGLGAAVTATGQPLTDVMVMDITDLASPRLAAQLPLILPDGSPTECHKVEFDSSESRMYCASDNLSSEAQPDGREPIYSVWPSAGPTIWDVTDVANGDPDPIARFVGQSPVMGQGGHHAVPMTVRDARGRSRSYLIAANELAFTCDMAAFPRIWDISDETSPVVVGELHLPQADECSGAHYNDVDDRENTTMALVGWTDAGFRVFDVRDPHNPRPLAYFKPGSACYSVAYFHPETEHIWFVCNDGFYVADLSRTARVSMSRPPRSPGQPTGVGSRDWVRLSVDPALPIPSSIGQTAIGFACWLPAAAEPRATPTT